MSSLDITRNPFESATDERLNFPGFSPSMFVKQETPASQKKNRTFRWSIEQISRLNPADIEEFPNQEYSSTFERDEEEEAQKAIDEYFSQSSIVPSPWTPNRSIKHVTFSPLPPTTAYISATSSAESSYTSPNSSALQGKKVDAGCQTRLSLPPQFNLEKLIGADHYNQEGCAENKDLSVSSLRRNLFPFGENSPQKLTTNGLPLPPPRHIKPILKSPHSTSPSNLITSSPMSSRKVPTQPYTTRSSTASSPSSPNMSPITKTSNDPLATPMSQTSRRLVNSPLSPMETSCHGVMESSGIEGVGTAFPDFSPIKDDEMASGAVTQTGEQEQTMDLGARHSNSDDGSMDESSPAVEMPSFYAGGADNKEDNDKLPELLTLRDLADDTDAEGETVPPEITIQDLSSSFEKDPCKLTDLSEKMNASIASDEGIQLVDSPDNPLSVEDKNPDKTDKLAQLQRKPDLPEASEFGIAPDNGGTFSSNKLGYRRVAHNPSYVEEIDGDTVMKRARAALCRADRISPPKSHSHVLLYSSQHHSDASQFRSSNMDMNLSSMPWQPKGMSTPLVRDIEVPRAIYDNINFVDQRSGTWRGAAGEGREYRPSPVVEEILRRNQILKSEANVSFSWTRPSTPPYEGQHHIKSTTPRTYPLSYLERKALYGGMKKEFETRPTGQDWHDLGTRHQVKRTSWPMSRPLTIRMGHGMRPLSPPLKMPSRIRTRPSGSVSKVALPYSYYDDNDSGYDSWRKGVGQWQHGLSSHHRRSPAPEQFGFY